MPKCSDYQGKINSRSGTSQQYPSLKSTSIGQVDGLFGINCRHQMYPYVEGMPRMARPQDAEENQRIYKEAQRQRQLEQEIRQAQRALAVLEVLGDEEMVTNAKTKVREKQARLQTFVEQTKQKLEDKPTSSHASVPAKISEVQEQQQEPAEQVTQQAGNAHSHMFPTAIIDPIVDEHILDKATEGKNRLSNRLKKKLNFAYAEVNISGIAQRDFYAHSQINEANKMPGSEGFSIQPVKPLFKAIKAPINDKFGFLRDKDTEYKILNDLAEQIGTKYQAHGTITLFTELNTCDSCNRVIYQFNEKYPIITIKVLHSKGINVSDSELKEKQKELKGQTLNELQDLKHTNENDSDSNIAEKVESKAKGTGKVVNGVSGPVNKIDST